MDTDAKFLQHLFLKTSLKNTSNNAEKIMTHNVDPRTVTSLLWIAIESVQRHTAYGLTHLFLYSEIAPIPGNRPQQIQER